MNQIPHLIENPEDPIFRLNEREIYLLKEAHELITIEKYSFILFSFWGCLISNIKRRIDYFGLENLFKTLKRTNDQEDLDKNLDDINDFDLIDYAKTINIINHQCHDLITSLYWMKNEHETVSKEEVFSIIFLLEKNLFIKEFKEDLREKQRKEDRREIPKGGRRKSDKKINTSTVSTTHDKLLLQSDAKYYDSTNETNDNNVKLINTYI